MEPRFQGDCLKHALAADPRATGKLRQALRAQLELGQLELSNPLPIRFPGRQHGGIVSLTQRGAPPARIKRGSRARHGSHLEHVPKSVRETDRHGVAATHPFGVPLGQQQASLHRRPPREQRGGRPRHYRDRYQDARAGSRLNRQQTRGHPEEPVPDRPTRAGLPYHEPDNGERRGPPHRAPRGPPGLRHAGCPTIQQRCNEQQQRTDCGQGDLPAEPQYTSYVGGRRSDATGKRSHEEGRADHEHEGKHSALHRASKPASGKLHHAHDYYGC